MLLPISFVVKSQGTAQGLSIVALSDNFFVYTTYKDYDGKPFPANASYLITSEGVVMFDTPWDSLQFQPILDSIERKHNKKVIACIATHSHADRTAGIDFFRGKGVKTYSSRLTAEICKETGEKVAEFTFKNDTIFVFGEQTVKVLYPGPGHTKDNIVMWVDKEQVLYGGCFIKSTEANDLGYIGEADLKSWPKSIKKVKKQFPEPKYVIPGHQSWVDKNSLDHTLKLLQENKSETKIKSPSQNGNS